MPPPANSLLCRRLAGLNGEANPWLALIWRTSPMAPSRTSASTFAVCGWARYMNASIRKRLWKAAVSTIAITSGWLTPSGFSHSTALPASNARIDHCACCGCGVAT